MSYYISLAFAVLGFASAFQLGFLPTLQGWGIFEGVFISTFLILFSVLISFLSLSLNSLKGKLLPTGAIAILLNFISTMILLLSIDWKNLMHF
jgi:hypothetical protein